AEDQEEGRDPHASPEAFETLKSFRQDLDRARLVVDCVKRREKLKRSALRFARAYWKIFDDTKDAPRSRPSRSSQQKPAAAPATATAAAPLAAASTSSRPSTRMAARSTSARPHTGGGGGGERCARSASGGGGNRSSGRAAAAAATAAMSAIAACEAVGEENEDDPAAAVGQEKVLPPPVPARSNSRGNGGGLPEQEHGWNTFAQLPTREESTLMPSRGLFVHRGVLPGSTEASAAAGGAGAAAASQAEGRQQESSAGRLSWRSTTCGGGSGQAGSEGVPKGVAQPRRSQNSRKA
ncbi:unnamed protein product, partial [Scytosiphon promiscuus]